MPITVPKHLPAKEILINENIFVMDHVRAIHQDIRPLEILILNLMPVKETTEVQLLRLLGNTPLQLNITLLYLESYTPKNTPIEHIFNFYKTFSDIKDKKFDGMIITGAPIETYEFEEVKYWNEMGKIMEWTKSNVTSTFHICWGAQAGLYYHYGVPKYDIGKKLSGVFLHKSLNKESKLLRGFDDEFYVPHSRFTTIKHEDVEKIEDLEILSYSEDAGVYIVASKDGKKIFVTGHSEYDPNTLNSEYIRDIGLNLNVDVPANYYKDNNPENEPIVRWRGHSNLLYSNWLNYYVYQQTPYDLTLI